MSIGEIDIVNNLLSHRLRDLWPSVEDRVHSLRCMVGSVEPRESVGERVPTADMDRQC